MSEDVRIDEGPPAPDKLPARWGRYELQEVLGSGGMGVVFRARDVASGGEVALKTLQFGARPTEEALLRLQREARTGTSLDHPGIVPVVDAGRVGKLPYLAMPFVRGSNLAQALAAGRFAGRNERVTLLRDVARAVGYAHRHKVIHRDLKPPNILVDEAGMAMVTDFGLAKRIDESSPITAPGQMLGTILYMPPEQIDGDLERMGPPADVYALGVILYELLTGKPPFQGATFTAIATQAMEAAPRPLREIDPSVPADLEAICLRALAKDPAQRPPDGEQLAEELDRHLRGEALAPTEKAKTADRPWWKKMWGGSAGV